MWYREAYKIGSVCEGTIQCTYANICDASGKVLFSIQRKNTRYHVHYTDLKTGAGGDVYTSNAKDVEHYRKFFGNYQYEADYTQDGVSFENWKEDYNGFHAEVIGDIPLVWIDRISDDRLVPAHILEEALGLMKKSILRVNDENIEDLANATFSEWLKNPVVYNVTVHVKDEDGNDKKAIAARYLYEKNAKNDPNFVDIEDPDMYVDIETGNGLIYETRPIRINDKYRKILNMKPGQLVYVKPAAFDWLPTDFNNLEIVIDGKTVNLSQEIRKTKKKIESLTNAEIVAVGGTIVL